MKRFSLFLLEAVMSRDEALRVLGLSGSYTADDLKKKYRAASMANHPDRGGSTEKMQQVNAAYAVLTGTTSSSNGTRNEYDREWWARQEEKRLAFAKVSRDAFDAIFRPVVFQKHFETVMGEGFTLTKEVWNGDNSWGGNWTTKNFEWCNADRTIVFFMQCSVSFDEMFKAKTIAAPDSFLSTSITTEILMNRKKVKLRQENWSWVKTREALLNPESVFPASKLKIKNTVSKAATQKPLKKADVLLTFKRELKATLSGDEWVYVPMCNGECVLVLTRMVFLRTGMWRIKGLYKASKYGSTGSELGGDINYASFYEGWEHMTPVFNTLKQLQQTNASPEEIVNTVNTLTAHLKTVPTEAGNRPIPRF